MTPAWSSSTSTAPRTLGGGPQFELSGGPRETRAESIPFPNLPRGFGCAGQARARSGRFEGKRLLKGVVRLLRQAHSADYSRVRTFDRAGGVGGGVRSPDPYLLRVVEAENCNLVAPQSAPAEGGSAWSGERTPPPTSGPARLALRADRRSSARQRGLSESFTASSRRRCCVAGLRNAAKPAGSVLARSRA